MWIIGFAEGGFVGPFPSQASALDYRTKHLAGRVANVFPLEDPWSF
jgi:hypothetical protein